MIRCLCCGKEIKETASQVEKENSWHTRCVKRFFGTSTLPEIELSDEILKELADKSTEKGYTVPGVQKKLSLHLEKKGRSEKPRLTLVNYPTGYILKPQTEEYDYLPEAEFLVMNMAKEAGIATVPFALVRQDGVFAYITKRIDREFDEKTGEMQMYAMEDFCQLDGKLTQDKYHGSYERCSKIVSRFSSRQGLDMTELFIRIVFSYVVGNSDMHMKNFSLIETRVNSREYILSGAYDMLPVNIILPEDKEEFALTLNGKKRNITRKDFLVFAESCQINQKVAGKLIESVLKQKEKLISLCEESYLPKDMKDALTLLVQTRTANLSNSNSSFK